MSYNFNIMVMDEANNHYQPQFDAEIAIEAQSEENAVSASLLQSSEN